MLSEGLPSTTSLGPNEDKYYMISLDDPNIVKLTIQLTTIHGDPDMFISSTSKTPSENDFERRSINSGLYPDIVEYEQSDDFTLTNNYYI